MTWLTNKWVIGGLALALSLGSVGFGWTLRDWRSDVQVAQVQAAFDLYRLEVLSSVNEENSRTTIALLTLNKTLQEIQLRLQTESTVRQTQSDLLVKELQDANGKSCALSPAIERYITSLLNRGLRDN